MSLLRLRIREDHSPSTLLLTVESKCRVTFTAGFFGYTGLYQLLLLVALLFDV